jgi:hypothetical protein
MLVKQRGFVRKLSVLLESEITYPACYAACAFRSVTPQGTGVQSRDAPVQPETPKGAVLKPTGWIRV